MPQTKESAFNAPNFAPPITTFFTVENDYDFRRNGTATIAPVDKIIGPGNAYVAAAKRRVFGRVGIDMIAGPSEILVVADRHNDPQWIAADLVSQAEHDSAAQAILDADPKGGKVDTLTQGFELTIPLYRTPETKDKRPFQVTDQNMADSVNLMVEYGGLDAKAKDNPKMFYTNDYLPK